MDLVSNFGIGSMSAMTFLPTFYRFVFCFFLVLAQFLSFTLTNIPLSKRNSDSFSLIASLKLYLMLDDAANSDTHLSISFGVVKFSMLNLTQYLLESVESSFGSSS